MAEQLEDGQIIASMQAAENGKEHFVISRTFAAPRHQVFAAWTEEKHLKQWFAPSGFTIPISRLNLVPGGAFHYCMRAANGTEMWGKWTFREIAPPERLILVNTFSNKHGNLIRHPFVPGWPLEILTTATFVDFEDQTRLTLRWLPIHASDPEHITFENAYEGMVQGWIGTFHQLAAYLATTF